MGHGTRSYANLKTGAISEAVREEETLRSVNLRLASPCLARHACIAADIVSGHSDTAPLYWLTLSSTTLASLWIPLASVPRLTMPWLRLLNSVLLG